MAMDHAAVGDNAVMDMAVGLSPTEALTRVKPHYERLFVFGAPCTAVVEGRSSTKSRERGNEPTFKAIAVGYDTTSPMSIVLSEDGRERYFTRNLSVDESEFDRSPKPPRKRGKADEFNFYALPSGDGAAQSAHREGSQLPLPDDTPAGGVQPDDRSGVRSSSGGDGVGSSQSQGQQQTTSQGSMADVDVEDLRPRQKPLPEPDVQGRARYQGSLGRSRGHLRRLREDEDGAEAGPQCRAARPKRGHVTRSTCGRYWAPEGCGL